LFFYEYFTIARICYRHSLWLVGVVTDTFGSDYSNAPSNGHGADVTGLKRDDLFVDVFGYTNRVPAADGKRFLGLNESGSIDPQTHYYKQRVKLSDNEDKGFAEKTDGELVMLSPEQFRKELTQSVESGTGRLGIYIPGLRNSPGEAAYNAAQMSKSAHETFLVADWDSSKKSAQDNIFDIAQQASADSESAVKSQPMVDSLAVEWINTIGGDNVDLIAHSRGSSILCNTLEQIQRLGLPPVRSATFSHGDKPVEKYAEMFPSMYKAAAHVNFLVDPDDGALKLSSFLRFLTTPMIDSNGDVFPSQATIGAAGLTDRLQQISAAYVPQNYFSVSRETGYGSQRHTPDLANAVAAISPEHLSPGLPSNVLASFSHRLDQKPVQKKRLASVAPSQTDAQIVAGQPLK
jgi:hypothetical protein